MASFMQRHFEFYPLDIITDDLRCGQVQSLSSFQLSGYFRFILLYCKARVSSITCLKSLLQKNLCISCTYLFDRGKNQLTWLAYSFYNL